MPPQAAQKQETKLVYEEHAAVKRRLQTALQVLEDQRAAQLEEREAVMSRFEYCFR